MIAVTTIAYIALIVLIYRILKIKPTPKNIAAMVVLGIFLIGTIVIFWRFSAPMSNQFVVTRYAVQIIPQVRGPITKIHAQPNVPLKKGQDILFEIQPDTYQLAVNQAKGSLDAAKKSVVQVKAGVLVAATAVKQAEANLSASEAELNVAREVENLNPDAISKLKVIQLTEKFNAAKAAVEQAKAVQVQAIAAQEAAEAKVPAIEAQLETAEFNLDQCIVYAPADGFVTNWQAREGTMAVPLPIAPIGTFIDTTKTTITASFPQNILKNVQEGDPVEVALKSLPGKVLTGKVTTIIEATGEGQFTTSGKLISASQIKSDGMYAVKIELDDTEIFNNLAMGTAGSVTIYSGEGKPFHVISKVTIRINAWLYYLNPS